VFFEALLQRREIVLALSAAHDFAVSLRRKDVHAQCKLRVGRVPFEVEGFQARRVSVHDDRSVELVRQHRFLIAAKVVAPLDRVPGGAEALYRFGVGDSRKRFLRIP